MSPKWIFFDLDDTLFDFSSASLITLSRLWEEYDDLKNKFSSPEAFIDEYHIHNTAMWQLHEQGKISSEFLKAERFRLTVYPDSEKETDIMKSRILNDRYLQLLGHCYAVCNGAHEMLAEISRKCLIGVLTNGFTEVQYEKLKTNRLDRFIQRMVISDEIGIQKPDSRLFRYAESATGARPEEIVMVGDNPANDIQGALDAGWKAIFYNRKGKSFESGSPLYLGETDILCRVAPMCGL